MVQTTLDVYDYTRNQDLTDWFIVDDVVMGGRSNGQIELSNEGIPHFFGKVSTENNGGFSSVRYSVRDVVPESYHSFFTMRIKGDGSNFQFRIKRNTRDYYSYVYDFKTSGEWEEIKIPFSDLKPSFRGRSLNMPNYQGGSFEEFGFLIGNKKNQDFNLFIDNVKIH